jgi:signal peptidase I
MQASPEVSQTADRRISPRSARNTLRTWFRDLVISIGISALIIVFFYQPVKVEGTSMMPGLDDQERIFVNKFVYHLEEISPGDIVVFRYPRDTSKSYIKRVVAGPGDRVRVEHGRVYVNGERLEEPYVRPEYMDPRSYEEITVPRRSYYLLGDHRNLSNDSRHFGPVSRDLIYGKAVFVYWPVARLGTLR